MSKAMKFSGVIVLLAACSNNPQLQQPTDLHNKFSTTGSTVVNEDQLNYVSVIDMVRRVPGVDVSAGSITIRGVSTINGNNDPLIVVDGLALSGAGGAYQALQMINPRDVAKLEVIKDATAAIWGIRGGNGVIQITLRH